MSELIDYRTKLTHETDAWLDALSKATGKDKAEIGREKLHALALSEIHEATIVYNFLNSKGLVRDSKGNPITEGRRSND